jgi:hypothetical protein
MRSFGLFNIAALILSLMIGAVAYVLVPNQSWTIEAVIALIFFALAVGVIFYSPSLFKKNDSKNDADTMASIGPIGLITGWTLLLTSVAFLLALLGMSKLALAFDIFAVGTFLSSVVMLRATLPIINDISARNSVQSNHILWQSEIKGLKAISLDDKTKSFLEQLAEKFRYAASDVPGETTPSDGLINDAIKDLGDILLKENSADVTNIIKKIDALVIQRDIYLNSLRNKS